MDVEADFRQSAGRDRTQIRWVLSGVSDRDPHLEGSKGYQLGSRLFDTGDVYEAQNARLPDPFVVKLLFRSAGAETAAVKAFSMEAGRVSILRHPHIVQVLDSGTLMNGTPFVAMERLHGLTLEERLALRGPLLASQLLPLLGGVATALTAAHAAGVVHREVRPDNIFVVDTANDEPLSAKLFDFGVSRLTWAQRAQGRGISATAAHYLAPEQARGDLGDVDARTDQFALAALTYRLLGGTHAFPIAAGAVEFGEPRPRPIFPSPKGLSAVDAVLWKALSKRPADRFPSVTAFYQACEEALTGAASMSVGGRDERTVSSAPAREVDAAKDANQSEIEHHLSDGSDVDPQRDFESVDRVPKRRKPLIALAILSAVAIAGVSARGLGWWSPSGWRGSNVRWGMFLLGAGSSDASQIRSATSIVSNPTVMAAARMSPDLPSGLAAPAVPAVPASTPFQTTEAAAELNTLPPAPGAITVVPIAPPSVPLAAKAGHKSRRPIARERALVPPSHSNVRAPGERPAEPSTPSSAPAAPGDAPAPVNE